MIPKFTRPVSALTLYVLAGASCFFAASFLVASVLGIVAPSSGEWTQYLSPILGVPALFLVSGIIFFSLGRIIHLSAEAAHYTKYLCWEHRIANQLTEKKQSEQRRVPPPLQRFHDLEPMERVFRSAID